MSRLASSTPAASEVVDRGTWNRLVLGFANADVRQSYEWGELLRGQGWEPHRLAVLDGDGCPACVSALSRRLPGTTHSLIVAPRGPLVSAGHADAWRSLVEALRDLAREVHAVFLRVGVNAPDDDGEMTRDLADTGFRPAGLDWSVNQPPRATMSLDVSGSEAEVLSRMHPKFRQRLQRAVRGGLTPTSAAGVDAALLFRDQFLVPFGAKKGFPVRDATYYRDLARLFRPPDGRIVFWQKDGRQLGGDLTVRFGDRAYALYFASDPEARALDLHRVSDWGIITWAREHGCRTIDYGAVGTTLPPTPGNPGYGLYQYKHDLGCRVFYSLGYHDLVFAPALYRLFRLGETHLLPRAWKLRARFNRRPTWLPRRVHLSAEPCQPPSYR